MFGGAVCTAAVSTLGDKDNTAAATAAAALVAAALNPCVLHTAK